MKLLLSKVALYLSIILSISTLNAQNLNNKSVSKEQILKTEIAKVWIENAIYTRQSILCLTDRLPGSQETLYRLMVNQEEIGELFNKYYGRKLGDEFCQLLSSNTSLIVRLIRSRNDGNTKELEATRKRIISHNTDIINFLVQINPYYNKQELEREITILMDLMSKQIDYRIRGVYDLDIENFDRIINESIVFSNFLSEGIIKLYPNKFVD